MAPWAFALMALAPEKLALMAMALSALQHGSMAPKPLEPEACAAMEQAHTTVVPEPTS